MAAPTKVDPTKVDITLSNPWRDPAGKVHDVGVTVTVDAELAERMVLGGAGVPAKSALAK